MEDQGEQRQADRGADEARQSASARQCRAADQRPPTALADLLVGDQVDVDGSGASHGGHAHPRGENLREPPAAAGPEYQLGGIHPARELEQRGRDVCPDHLVVRATEALHQEPLLSEIGRVGSRKPIRAHHMHGHEIRAFGTRGDTGRPPDQRFSLRATGQRQNDPLPSLPGLADPVFVPVPVKLVVDLVGQPEQGQLTQRGEVADPEVVAQCGLDLVRLIDVAVRHPAPQGLGSHVGQFDLVGLPDHLVGHGLPLGDASDLVHHVVERLQVLDVHRGEHGDPCLEQILDVLPALGVARPGHVAVGQLVNEGDLRPPGQDGVDVHFGERGASVLQRLAGHHLQIPDQLLGVLPTVSLDEADHHVGAATAAPVRLLEHGEGLAHARCGPKVDPKLSTCHSQILPLLRSTGRGRSISARGTPGPGRG